VFLRLYLVSAFTSLESDYFKALVFPLHDSEISNELKTQLVVQQKLSRKYLVNRIKFNS